MKVFAHNSTVALGDTLRESLQNALSSSADAVEVDVRQSAGFGYICHDDAIFKGRAIEEMNKSWLFENGALRLTSVMDLARDSDKQILFDIKPADRELPVAITDMAEACGIPAAGSY